MKDNVVYKAVDYIKVFKCVGQMLPLKEAVILTTLCGIQMLFIQLFINFFGLVVSVLVSPTRLH